MSDRVPNDWWVAQDEDESWQQQQLEASTEPRPAKDEFKLMLLDVMRSSLGESDPPF